MTRVLVNALQAGNRSGTGRYTVELCAALALLKDSPETVTVWPSNLPRPEGIGATVSTGWDGSALGRLFFDHYAFRELAAREAAEVLFYPASVGPLLPSKPVVLTIHDLCAWHHPGWFSLSRACYYRSVIPAAARRADVILADSAFVADDVERLLKIPASRIRVARLGVSPRFSPAATEAREAVRRKHKLPERFFLYVGTHEPRKNLPRLIRAWDAAWCEGFPALVIAGRSGWKDAAVKNTAARARNKAGIYFPGFIEEADLPALLSAALAFVWPSLLEGFGLPPLEAMACGTPVLASNTGSLPEVVGGNAVTVSPFDEGGLSDALRMLAGDGALRNRLAVEGCLRASAFTWEKTARVLADACNSLT